MENKQEASLENDTLAEIADPIARAKLTGIQEAVFGIDGMILQLRKGLDEKRGVIAASELIAKRLFDECLPVQKAVDEEAMDKAEAKVRIEVIQKLTNVVREIAAENRKDLISLQGQIIGLEKAAKTAEEKFNGEAMKYQRWERMQAEDAADRAQKRPEAADVDAGGKGKGKPKAPPMNKPKGGKAAKKSAS